MAIEDIIQIKESVKENPMGDPQTVNQAEFLRFQEQMGMGVDGIMAKIIQMFVEAPSNFTRQFGVEAADSVREFLGNQTQRELEGQGRVFAPDSAEIIGQNIDYRPERSAIGTLQTDQADQSEQMMEFMKKQLQFTPQSATSVLRAVKEGETTDLDSLTEWMEEKGLDGLNIDKSHLDRGENTLRVITDEEAEALGFKTGDGKIYQIDETGKVTLKKPGLIEGGILKLMDWFKYGRTDPENR
tara:strand:+ start:5490 stop:6215 length:726 start_codon:yes stop_codon:yes gene_type:complete